jgi:hypothetical protein
LYTPVPDDIKDLGELDVEQKPDSDRLLSVVEGLSDNDTSLVIVGVKKGEEL